MTLDLHEFKQKSTGNVICGASHLKHTSNKKRIEITAADIDDFGSHCVESR